MDGTRMKYAIKVTIDDGGWLYVTETKEDGICDIATYDTFEEAEERAKLWKNGIVVECQYTEAERLRAKKQAIKEELYDKVKMEMFKASSKLEGIDYDKISRVEVIDETGRGYIRYLKEDENVRYDLQDDGRTLKIFIDDLDV